jgi:hypothetical protein
MKHHRILGLLAGFLFTQVAVSYAVARVVLHFHQNLLIRGDTGETEHWLATDWECRNVLKLKNRAQFDSDSAISYDSATTPDGEQMRGAASGFANPSKKGLVFDDCGFFETSDLRPDPTGPYKLYNTPPPPFRLVQTGLLDGMPGSHLRMECTSAGDIFFYLPGVFPSQKPEMELSRDGNITIFGDLRVLGKIN